MDTLLHFADLLEQTALGSAIAESRYAFPIIEGAHLLGLSLSVGLILFSDLRLLGLIFRKIPAFVFLRQLRAWTLSGFALTFISGILLFIAEATAVLASPAFAFKLLFIALAGLNLLYFEHTAGCHRPAIVANGGNPSNALKLSATLSLALWILIIVCGRLIPYLPNWS